MTRLVKCETCDGGGELVYPDKQGRNYAPFGHYGRCDQCAGTGEVPIDDETFDDEEEAA